MIDLRKDKRFKYILVFKNKGPQAGASIEHPHSQIMALPIVPLRVTQELGGSKQYFEYKDRCIFCDIIKKEIEDRERLVEENEGFVSFVPFAPVSPLNYVFYLKNILLIILKLPEAGFPIWLRFF